MELDVRQIQKVIPHRFPFLLLDRVVDLEPNVKLLAIKNVSVNEHFFVGHFPKEKIMPGVLILEAMAQAACIYYAYSRNLQEKSLVYYLAKTEAKFHKPVVPGDQLKIEITTIKFLKNAGFVHAKTVVQDELVAEAEIGFSVREA